MTVSRVKRFAVLLLAVLLISLSGPLACSKSHHDSTDQTEGVTSPWGEYSALGGKPWGTWTCSDHCGCFPPKDFVVTGWSAMHDNDLCGSAFACEYRCHDSCS